ncbi:AEC family transporter [Hyphobacterium sp. CCMP332]|uniref:AEC family transporter n=1 Tax=Hyphobacterium sp. CCMP332 TaxID=2749086 RepID=UPI00164EDD08|nr:AEC family transporter [Hyphobacterium sp. CCMP332]QNL18893.1 AEC family transporter [Hyphobacterium sp. CCMP332]
MTVILGALLPIFAVIGVGWGLRRSNLMPSEMWPAVSRLAYVGLSPALLFSVISRADFQNITVAPAILAAVLGFLSMGGLVIALKPLIKTDGPAFTSVFQGSVRWNGLVILALATLSYGLDGEVLVSLIMVATIPVVNVMAVTVLTVWGAHEKTPDIKAVLWRIISNPLILGCIAGAIANLLNLFQTGPIADVLALMGRAALPLILLAVGAGLDFTALNARRGLLALTAFNKLIIAPLVFGGIAWALGVRGEALAIVVLVGASPGAASAYVLAQQLGGDRRLSAGDVTATTLLSFVTLPVAVWIATQIG